MPGRTRGHADTVRAHDCAGGRAATRSSSATSRRVSTGRRTMWRALSPVRTRWRCSGWLTLANFSATSFSTFRSTSWRDNLPTTGGDRPVHPRAAGPRRQIAGRRRSIGRGIRPPPPASRRRRHRHHRRPTAPATGPDNGDRRRHRSRPTQSQSQALGDYKLYPLPEPITRRGAANEANPVSRSARRRVRTALSIHRVP